MAKNSIMADVGEWLTEYCVDEGLTRSEVRSLKSTLGKLDDAELLEAVGRSAGISFSSTSGESSVEFVEGCIASLQAFQLVELDRSIRSNQFLFGI